MFAGKSRWVTRRRAEFLIALVIATAWFLWFRPQSLGGPTAFTIVRGESMLPGLSAGDLVIARREQEYRVGDVVTYLVPSGDQKGARVIHRITGGTGESGFTLQGDNKTEPDPWHPRTGDVVGSTWLRFPGVGRAFLWLRTPGVLAAFAGGLAFSLAMTWKRPSADGGHPDDGLVEGDAAGGPREIGVSEGEDAAVRSH
ncbi:MAG: S24/S26 family peptidase [Acidimicrobiia bacterium]